MSFAAGIGRLVQDSRLPDGSTVDRFAWLPGRDSQTSGGDPDLETPAAALPRPVAAAGFNRWNDWFGPWQWRHAAAVSATAKRSANRRSAEGA